MTKLKPTKTFKEVLECWDEMTPAPEGEVVTVVSIPSVSNTSGTPMTPKTLDPSIVSALEARLKDEYTAHYFYRAATNWCQDKNYKKASEFFKNEADSELEHAQKIQEYMTDFNVIPEIPQSPIEHKFDGLIEIIKGAYKMELGLMKSYNENSKDLFSIKCFETIH